ncbi:MAG: hypothetical protein GF398_08495 [Chitinivibrionales bacterium]|nr:hypothetical protein [Chitinivibrionales bacterium]
MPPILVGALRATFDRALRASCAPSDTELDAECERRKAATKRRCPELTEWEKRQANVGTLPDRAPRPLCRQFGADTIALAAAPLLRGFINSLMLTCDIIKSTPSFEHVRSQGWRSGQIRLFM